MKRTFSLLFLGLVCLSFSADAQYREIRTLAGSGGTGGYGGDGYAATGAIFNGPRFVTVDITGNVFITDYFNARVRKVETNGTIVDFAGNGIMGYSGDGSAAPAGELFPLGIANDRKGNVYISDPSRNNIRKVNTLGILSTFAGNGAMGYSGDTGPALSASFDAPFGMTFDKSGNLYIADAGNHVIRMIDTFGIITTVAGDGVPGYLGDGLAATNARLDSPYAVAVDNSGNLYIADHNNNVIRKVDNTGTIYTIAGTYGIAGYSGDGGTSLLSTINYPTGVAVDTAGQLYISDSYNNVIRMINTLGDISTVVGNGWAGFGGDLGAPLGANLFHPHGVAVDTFGSIYIVDANNQRVRKVYTTSLGVHDIVNITDNDVYPNPSVNEVTVSGLLKSEKVGIYDLTGRAVTELWTIAHDGRQSFNISNLAPGMYILKVFAAEGNNKSAVTVVKQ